jgi:hypothetical protein
LCQKLKLKVGIPLTKLKESPLTMIILSQIYLMFKEKARAEFARKVLLENLKQNREIFKKTAKEM